MGRIIRNGIEYGSGNENATNINYDGAVSGLEATTVQEAIDKIAAGGDYTVEKLNTSIISAAGTHTIKNMSDYKMLILSIVGSTADIWETPYMIPYEYFKTRNNTEKAVYISAYSGNNAPTFMLNYASDTEVNITTLTPNRGLNIYGVKTIAMGGSENGSGESLDNSYKAYDPLFGTTYGQGAIVDVLAVDVSSVDGEFNKVGYVYKGHTNGLPDNCSHGIREVYFYNGQNVFIKIIGADTSSKYNEWGNFFNGTTWTGWVSMK